MSIFVSVASSILPESIEVGSIFRSADDEIVRYVPERTCTIRKRDENNGECSNCGFVAGIYDGYDPFEETYTGNHCINCGAKVVSE